jgi:cellulose biosynthesis protein BcsQ
MTKTIDLIQVKGGAGRSTVSTNLAGEFLNRTQVIAQ